MLREHLTVAETQLAGETDPKNCVLLDDSIRNLIPASEAGFTTVLVGSKDREPAADYSIHSLRDLPHEFPDLWTGRSKLIGSVAL